MSTTRPTPAQSITVFLAEDCVATDGANMGDTLSFADELILDDYYTLKGAALAQRLAILPHEDGHFSIAPDTGTGTSGAALHIDSALTFMHQKGDMLEALLLVEVNTADEAENIYLMPLAKFETEAEYRLVGIDIKNARQRFAQMGTVSFTRGTLITMASGKQRLIEDLNIGDRVLTRDDGIQEIRWIGQETLRAMGDFAPICIRAGTLNNENDLVVSPDHRLFIYQREDALGAGRSELLVKAQHLVNGDTVVRQQGGFVDYYQLLFDSHQIIYAEGIAAETMLIDSRTKAVLPSDVSEVLGNTPEGHATQPHSGLDVNEELLDRDDAAEILRRSSTR